MVEKGIISRGNRGSLFPEGFFEDFPDLLENVGGMIPTIGNGGLSLSEDEKNIYVEAALPGLKADDVEVTLEKGVLWIKGDKKMEESDKKRKYYRKARSSFSYSFTLPQDVKEDNPEATFVDGVMMITFKKSKPERAKKISFKSK